MANEKRKVVRRIKASTNGGKAAKVVATATVPKPQLDDSSLIQTEKAERANATPGKISRSEAKATKAKDNKRDNSNRSNDRKSSGATDADVKSSTKAILGKKRRATKSDNKPFILFRPFVALGRYIRDSWRELRKVEWPSRRATWKMTLGVIVFCVFIGVFVLVCDWASQWLIQEVVL